MVFSTFDMDKFGKIRQHHYKIAKFESDTS